MRHVLLALACIAINAQAQVAPCDAKLLAPGQGWNPSNAYVTPELDRFYGLGAKMVAAYNSANPTTAEPIARDYLQTSGQFPCNWNYGNAVHDANTILGLLALHDGKTNQAVEFLGAAGASNGSPQLNTFGPSMILAKELSEAGRQAAVIGYLRSVKRFWTMDRGSLDSWVGELEAKRIPDFGMNLRLL